METITSRKNPLIVHMKKLGSDKSFRYLSGEFLCQGAKLFDEAKKHASISAVLFCGDEPSIPQGTKAARVPKEIMESISPMDSVPDVIFSCSIPKDAAELSPGRYIVLEDLQDPGNVGTILRTANAFMIDGVILAGSCADPYNPKTVRASMGAIFRQRIFQLPLDELISKLNEQNIPLYATGLDNNCLPLEELKKAKSLAVAIGNEGQGLSVDLFNASKSRVTIPMNPACESLNAAVAAAVIMWELYK